MNKKDEFIHSFRKELETELLMLNKDKARINAEINNITSRIRTIKKEIDTTYTVLSASQSVNSKENTEVESLYEILQSKQNDINDVNNEIDKINIRLSEIESIDKSILKRRDINYEIIDKLEMIKKFIPVDPIRAQNELDTVISKLQN